MGGNLEMLESMRDDLKKLWWETPSGFPKLEKQFDEKEKKAKEKYTDLYIDKLTEMIKELQQAGGGAAVRPGTSERARDLLREVGRNVLEIEDKNLDIILDDGFFKTTSDFITKAREFDASIRIDDIMQAMRNVWIMNCIQVLSGLRVAFSPSIFAYSMLYPYTDNFLDANDIDREEKKRALKRLGMKLAGNAAMPLNEYDKSVFKLVDMIEEQFPRKDYPDIYRSLISIHQAQQDSLAQQNRQVSPYELNILDITFNKGGTSVLADAYLVNGNLSNSEAGFMFSFGILLQLADDLQDTGNDLAEGHMTIFSQTAGKWKLDLLTNKLLNFTLKILDKDSSFTSGKMKDMLEIIKYNCILLILAAVANNGRYYSREYLKKIERYSPLSFGYLKKLYSRLNKEFDNIRKSFGGEHAEAVIAAVLAQ